MSDGPLLLVEGLRAMRGRRLALEDIGFSLSPGDRIFLDGENGSGKTTLLEALLGLLPSTAIGASGWADRVRPRSWVLSKPGPSAIFRNSTICFHRSDTRKPLSRLNAWAEAAVVVLDQIVADFPEFDPLLASRPSAL